MVVLLPDAEFGYAPQPQTPYSIVTNFPGWDLLYKITQGDFTPFQRLFHVYPRFAPTHFVAALGQEIAKKTGQQGKACMVYFNPQMLPYTATHVTRDARGELSLDPEKLTFKCVEIAGHRLYAVLFDPPHSMSVATSWDSAGRGLSIRAAEELLKSADSMVELPFTGLDNLPEPTYSPEGAAHQQLRERIVELLHHSAIEPERVTSESKDVFLYQTGMAAVVSTTNLVQEYRQGASVVLGVVFDTTRSYLSEESPNGFKHVGKVDKQSLDDLETWLDEESTAGRHISFVVTEFGGNPTLDTPDLVRMKKLSEKHGFVLITDDTVAGFGNVDLLAHTDILLTSLTKSFSGQSNVLGGSIVLNPLSPHYKELSVRFTSTHRNELFLSDAEVLLANSHDYYSRMRRFNRNAEAMATFLHRSIGRFDSPVTDVQYPSLLPSKPEYDAFLRRRSPEIPEPGYGCLFTVNFESVETARAFYDNCGFWPSPHLGGHVTIMLAFNMLNFGKKPALQAEFRNYGARAESVRISAGLEDVEDLLDTLNHALDAAVRVKLESAKTTSS